MICSEIPIEKGKCYLYALVDPRTGEPRYIGISVSPKSRYRAHQYECKDISFVNWWKEIEAKGETE